MNTTVIFSVVVASYLIGSVPFAWLLARRCSGVDLRLVGSRNVGATNVFRASGLATALLVVVLDMLKGAASVVLATRASDSLLAAALAGVMAIVGHIYPVWLRCRGGKGVATACGVFSVLTPLAVPPVIAVFIAAVWATRYVSAGSMLAAVVLPAIVYATGSPAPAIGAACAASALIIFRHHSNLERLWTGTERRLVAGEQK